MVGEKELFFVEIKNKTRYVRALSADLVGGANVKIKYVTGATIRRTDYFHRKQRTTGAKPRNLFVFYV